MFLEKRLKKTLRRDPAKAETWNALYRVGSLGMQDRLSPARFSNSEANTIPCIIATHYGSRELVIQRMARHLTHALSEDGSSQ